METFSALLAICAGNSPVLGEFPTQRPVTRCVDVFFHLRLNKRLSKQSWGRWFETPSCPLWRHRNGTGSLYKGITLLSFFVMWPVDSRHKGPVMQKAFPCHHVIMSWVISVQLVTSLLVTITLAGEHVCHSHRLDTFYHSGFYNQTASAVWLSFNSTMEKQKVCKPSPHITPISQRPVTRSFDVFFDLRLYKRLSKHS